AANGRALVVFPPMPPGSYELEVDLEEHGVAAAPSVREKLRLRVLPAAIELRIAKAQSRFLPGVERAGVLQRVGDGYREGQGWALDRELARYVRGTLFVGYGAETLVPTPLPSPSGPAVPFLPEIVPLPGYNLLAVALTDVLGRDVRVLVGDSPPGQRTFEGRTVDVVAEFYWHDQPPEPIGEELLVEYGQPARLRLRLPLPYVESDRPDLRLGLSESEVVASRVESDGDGAAIATFELPFEVWRAAARLRDEPREAFAAQLARSVDVSVRTPVGRYDLALAFRTVRSTLRPITLSEIGEASVGVLPAALAGIRLVPVLAPAGPFVEPVPSTAPPRALFRPQVAVAVRNLPDLLLQDHELTIAEAAAIVQIGTARAGAIAPARLVHADDPLGPGRLEAENLLPGDIAVRGPRAGELPATGLDFFQAYTCCRLLGVALAGDPELFRLPMGCELELAAFGEGRARACNGPAAAGRPLAMAAFLAAAEKLAHGEVASVAATVAAGDLGIGGLAPIAGLDFGVREWVGDLPHIDRNELLLKEWIADHEGHLARVAGFASGQLAPPADLADRLRTVGVVRGLALGEVEGLLQPSGQRLDPGVSAVVPASVPGVLRTEQLRRDGRDFLSRGADARLARVGFRVAGTAALIARIRGLR
ncbi:MAG: hypothetical protein KDE27_27570, partial [Planctomycetes bacterium]|nr:hypothetical protein [Planctomycetota bacterium]